MRAGEDARLSLERLLKGYTINTVIQLRIDDITGSIEVGKRANYNIYDVNLFDVPETEFKDVLPKTVVFEGKVIAENERQRKTCPPDRKQTVLTGTPTADFHVRDGRFLFTKRPAGG